MQQDKLILSPTHISCSNNLRVCCNLVAGVAHEINNPIGFLKGSLNNAKEYTQDLLAHIRCYQQHYPNPAIAVIEHGDNSTKSV